MSSPATRGGAPALEATHAAAFSLAHVLPAAQLGEIRDLVAEALAAGVEFARFEARLKDAARRGDEPA